MHGGAFADAVRRVGSALSEAIGNSLVGYVDRQVRQRSLPRAYVVDLLLALMATRMMEIAYYDTPDEVLPMLSEVKDVPGGLQLLYLRTQRDEETRKGEVHPQWLLASGALPEWSPHPSAAPLDPDPPMGSVPVGGAPHEPVASSVQPPERALYLVFRGTWSAADMLRDLCVEPEEFGGRLFHGGFLAGVRDDPTLHATLKQHVRARDAIFIFGHSLGGSLAMTLVEAGMLPPEHCGPVTVVGAGSPPPLLGADLTAEQYDIGATSADGHVRGKIAESVFLGNSRGWTHQRLGARLGAGLGAAGWSVVQLRTHLESRGVDTSALKEKPELIAAVEAGEAAEWVAERAAGRAAGDIEVAGSACAAAEGEGASEEKCATGEQPATLSAAAPRSIPRYYLIINDCDVIPRLLGSPMPVATMQLIAASGGPIVRRNIEMMRTMEQYHHPPQTEGLLLRDGDARAVPPADRSSVLHLGEAISSQLLEQHSSTLYIAALEIACAMAQAEDGEDDNELDEMQEALNDA
jgi:hypothetical protein